MTATIGRPRKFDPEQALRGAMLVFWEKGYLGASLKDLTQGMGINGPSLYATFGDKERLFLASVDHYIATHGQFPRAALDAPNLPDALQAFFDAVVANTTGEATPPGCLIACVLVGASAESEAIKEKLRACMAMTDAMLQHRLERAVENGEIPAAADVRELSRLANSLRHGLALRARAGEPRKALRIAARGAVDMLLATTRTSPGPVARRGG